MEIDITPNNSFHHNVNRANNTIIDTYSKGIKSTSTKLSAITTTTVSSHNIDIDAFIAHKEIISSLKYIDRFKFIYKKCIICYY
ncbi:hypothetical protein [Methanosalsum natronophilum]|uniref:hypothetical protein n=1 Tax=Methanosalsum natronophilum TaxID=768733 RepID=UPI002167DF61|nr:hypothetical protein [Methanosalsum natronophilum]